MPHAHQGVRTTRLPGCVTALGASGHLFLLAAFCPRRSTCRPVASPPLTMPPKKRNRAEAQKKGPTDKLERLAKSLMLLGRSDLEQLIITQVWF